MRLLLQCSTLCLILLLQIEVSISQNTWIVNNDPGFTTADFDTIQHAVDAATAGDIIYVHGSSIEYPAFTIDKKLHIIGSGFWKTENSIITENLNPTSINGYITINPGSDSSIVEGMRMLGCLIGANHVVFRYNHTCCWDGGTNSNGAVVFSSLPVNPIIYSNYLNNSLNGSATGAIVYNNIFIRGWIGTGGIWASSAGNIDCLVQNNAVSAQTSIATDCTFRNNICENPNFQLNNVIAQNNIFVDDDVSVNGVPTDSLGNGNIDSVDISTIWNLSNPSPDAKYQLIGDSLTNVAFNAGISGEDCGAFGGVIPYRLSGIVKIPSIYQMLIPPVGDTLNMLNVTIKAKSN